MAKTTSRIVGPAPVATGPTTVYTVPASTVAVIRHIHVQNPSASPVNFTLSIGADAAGTRLFDAFPIPAQGSGITANVRDDWGPYTLAAGTILQAAAGTNNILVLTIDADLLTP